MDIKTKRISKLPQIEAIGEKTNIIVEENGEAKKIPAVNMGNGLPEGGAPHQQLVTDGEGVAKWEEKPFGETVTETVVYAEQTVEFTYEEEMSLWAGGMMNGVKLLEEGAKYKVLWGEKEYTCVAYLFNDIMILGNLSLAGTPQDTGEPFIMVEKTNSDGSMFGIEMMTADDGDARNVGIIEVTETIKPINSKYLPDTVSYFYTKRNTNDQSLDNVLYKDIEYTQIVTAKELSDAISHGIVRIHYYDYAYDSWCEPYFVINRYESEANHTVLIKCINNVDNGVVHDFNIEYSASEK